MIDRRKSGLLRFRGFDTGKLSAPILKILPPQESFGQSASNTSPVSRFTFHVSRKNHSLLSAPTGLALATVNVLINITKNASSSIIAPPLTNTHQLSVVL